MVAIVQWNVAVTRFSLAHEIGHLFGCEHDDRYAEKPDPFNNDYRFAYFVDHPERNELHTMMA